MRWQQRLRVATGLGCWQIMLHLLVVVVLVAGWMSKSLVLVGMALCVLYAITVILMLVLQRFHSGWLREFGDFLEELTTTWYFGTAMIGLWLLSRVFQSHVVLVFAGLIILAGPAIVSLLAKDTHRHSGDFSAKHGIRR